MSNIRTASAFSLAATNDGAAAEIFDSLSRGCSGPPSLLILFATQSLAQEGIASKIAACFPGVPIFGGTSCRGVITDAGIHLGQPHAVGALAIWDASGAYASASAPIGDDPRAAAGLALSTALERAGRSYETPAQIWTCQPPGCEEEILAGFADIVGPRCPIIGGSSADENIEGGWRQFSHEGVLRDCVVVAVLFPSAPLGLAFKSGYAPTECTGVATKCDSHRLIEIDGRPAARVYSEWTKGGIDPAVPGNILQPSTPSPLARRVGAYAGVDEFLLSHPATVEPDGALTLFTSIAEGDVLYVMSGSRESLIERGGQVIRDAQASLPTQTQVSGGFVIYCGGCMLAVSDELAAVAEGMRGAFYGAPFLAAFTFGEQGALVSAGNRHGNLMIAASVLGCG